MHRLVRFLPAATLLAPAFVFAQNFGYLNNLGGQVLNFINGVLVPLVFALAALVFFWGVFKYFILGRGSEDNKTEGKNLMLWGIGGFVLMVALWGIVQLVINILGINAQQNIQLIPNAPTGRNSGDIGI